MNFVPRYCHCRTVLHTALAVLVMAALSRCSWEESRELAQWLGVVAQHRLALPSPIQAPVHDCDRESGCICRGATQVIAVTASQCQAELSDLLLPPVNELAGSWLAEAAANAISSSADDFSSLPPISGRQLRALYASFVI